MAGYIVLGIFIVSWCLVGVYFIQACCRLQHNLLMEDIVPLMFIGCIFGYFSIILYIQIKYKDSNFGKKVFLKRYKDKE